MGWGAPVVGRNLAGLAKAITTLGVVVFFYVGWSVGWRSLSAQETSEVKVRLQVIVVDTEAKAREALERLK